jgi:hypothetical protein
LLAAAVIAPEALGGLRRQVAALRLPRQRRLHFTAESDRRRKTILAALIEAAGPCVVIYDAPGRRSDREARDLAMARLVDDAAKIGAARLVIERDEPAIAGDRRIIRDRATRAGCLDTLRYEHRRPHEDCLLAIPDAAAWCWAKSGDWRHRAGPLISHVVTRLTGPKTARSPAHRPSGRLPGSRLHAANASCCIHHQPGPPTCQNVRFTVPPRPFHDSGIARESLTGQVAGPGRRRAWICELSPGHPGAHSFEITGTPRRVHTEFPGRRVR